MQRTAISICVSLMLGMLTSAQTWLRSEHKAQKPGSTQTKDPLSCGRAVRLGSSRISCPGMGLSWGAFENADSVWG